MKKRALSLLLVFAMILSFVPTTALAAGSGDSENTEVTTEEKVKALQADLDKGGTVTLTEDITLGETRLEIKNDVTLDLDGHTITYNVPNSVQDNSYYPAILIVMPDGANESVDAIIKNGAVETSGSVATPCGIYVSGGVSSVTLNDVDITASRSNKGEAWALAISHPGGGSSTVVTKVTLDSACSVTGCGGIVVKSTNLKGTVSPTHLVELDVGCDVTSTSTQEIGGDWPAISGHGQDSSNPKITIRGNVTATTYPTEAIYLPETSTTIIEDGATVTGKAGIAMKSGTLEVKGGATIKGIGPYKTNDDCRLMGGGVNADGSAIFIESNKPPYHGNMNVTIAKDAKLESEQSYAIRENPAISREPSGSEKALTAINSVTIEAGATLIASEKFVDAPIQFTDGAIDKIHIKGGTYSLPVEYKYLAASENSENPLKWQADKSGTGAGPYTYYATVDDAWKAGETNVTERTQEELKSDALITLNYNDGGEETKGIAATYRVKYNAPFDFPDAPNTEQTGITFAGWKNKDTTDTNLYKKGGTNGQLKNVTKNYEFTATWSELGATVELKPDTTAASIQFDDTALGNLKKETVTTDGTTTTVYTVADKTKDVTFKLTGNSATDKDIAVSYQVGSGTAHELSCDANEVYTLPASTFSSKISTVTIKVSLVNKKTVTFDFGTLTGLDVDSQNLTNLTKDTAATDAKKYTVNNKTAIATFKLTGGSNTQKFTVTYKVGETGTEETLEPNKDGVYTLPANLAGDVTVTVTAVDKNTITLAEIDESAKAYVEEIKTATDGNLQEKDTANNVYVATDDTKPISFVVTAKADSNGATVALPENENIVVKYKLAKDEDSAYKPVSAQSVSEDKKTYTCTLNADAITGDIIVKVFLEATPVYEATPSVSGSTSTTTITETEVIANIDAAKAQDEPLTIKATTETTTVTKSEVELDGNLIQTITSTETNVDLAVKTDVGIVELPSKTVSEIVKDNSLTENDPLTVKVEDQKDQIETFTEVVANAISLFDVTLMSGSTPVAAENLSIKITLSFYIGTGLINPKLYRFEDGKGIELSDVRYDAKTGFISGKTDHLSQFYGAVAADASIVTVLGKSVGTKGTGRLGEPEVVPVQVSSDKTTITANDIVTKVEKLPVTLYSDAFETVASSITLKDGANVVYAKVENATDTNGSTAYYKITVDKAAASTDCTLETVLGEVVKTTGGAGTKEEPYVVTVVSNAAKLKATDIVTTSTSAIVKLYDSGFETEVTATDGSNLTNEQGARESAYATVTNGGTTVYYEIVATGAAITPLDVTLSDDGTKVNVDPSTVTAGATRKYAIVTDNPEFTIASWNTATTEGEAKTALDISDNLGQLSSFTPTNTHNGKYIVVVDVTSGQSNTIVAAGSMKIQLPVTVTIDGDGLADGDTLTVARGTNEITATNNKVPYGTSLNLTLSNANYVVYAGDDVVPMNGINGTYTVTGDTTFSVEPGYSVTITNDSNADLTVQCDPYGGGDIPINTKGVSMVPQKPADDPTMLNITLKGNYILMVDGVEKLAGVGTTSVPVTKDTTIEVVPGYKVTVTTAEGVNLQVKAGEVTIPNNLASATNPTFKLVEKDTELTIRFSDFDGDYKVQVNGHPLPFSTTNTTISYTVTADTEINVVSSSAPDKVEELTVTVDPTTGTPSVTKEGEPVTDGVVYAVVGGTKPPVFTGWMNNKTQDEALTQLNATVINPPLTTANNNQYLVALQIDEAGKVIAAGCSDSIKVSSPTTPTTGYTVSGTVSKGDTSLTDVAGIDVTLKAEDGTRMIITLKEDGNYAFKNLENGTYTLEIALSANYKAVSKSIEVKDDNVTQDITLEKVDLEQEALTMTGPTDIENSNQKKYTVNGVVKGMYYTVTLSGDKLSIPFYYTECAGGDSLSFTCPEGTIIDILEFGTPIKYDADGMLDMSSNTRNATNRDEPVQ